MVGNRSLLQASGRVASARIPASVVMSGDSMSKCVAAALPAGLMMCVLFAANEARAQEAPPPVAQPATSQPPENSEQTSQSATKSPSPSQPVGDAITLPKMEVEAS